MNAKPTPRVLLIAWDGAEWDVIAPLLESGDLPNCERLIDRGVMGKMVTLQSALAPLAWNSVATGRPPEEHGIIGYKEPAPDGRSVRPFSSAARRARTLWDILSEHGFKTHVIGWPASHPAERVNGLTISEVFDEPVGELQAPWPVPAGSVEPADRVETFAELRMHPGEITRHDLRTFVPEIDSVNPREEPAVLRLAQAIALAASRQALTTYVMENEPWDFFALYQPTLERVSREFLQFHPPQLAGIGQREFERYQGVVRESYRFHDAMLGRLLELVGDDATILLCSTCGFHTGALRAPVKSPGTASFAAQHRSAGWFVLHGPAVRVDELIFGSRLYDIVPTVLTLFGLPVGRDMPGRVWQEAFLDPLTTTFLPTWETTNARPAGMPSGAAEGRASARPGPAETPPSSLVPDSPAFVVARENQFNLARCLQSAGRSGGGAAIAGGSLLRPAGAYRTRSTTLCMLPRAGAHRGRVAVSWKDSRAWASQCAGVTPAVSFRNSISCAACSTSTTESARARCATSPKRRRRRRNCRGCTSNSVGFISGCICMTRPRMRFDARSRSIPTHRGALWLVSRALSATAFPGGGRTRDAGRSPRPVVRRASSSARALPCPNAAKDGGDRCPHSCGPARASIAPRSSRPCPASRPTSAERTRRRFSSRRRSPTATRPARAENRLTHRRALG